MRRAVLVAVLLALCGCDDGSVYTLYRSSPTIGTIRGEDARIHIATFDASAGEDYNRENCESAQNLFASQQGVTVPILVRGGRFEP